MSENAALLREIAKLSGTINNHKRQQESGAPQDTYRGRGWRGRGSRGFRGRGHLRGTYRGRGAPRGGIRGGGFIPSSRTSYKKPEIDQPCTDFTATGRCGRGLSCRYKHDPSHVALCKTILHGQECRNPTCTLNHDMNEHNAPLCTHFAKGHCTRDDCRFTHMTSILSQDICPSFSLQGWCDHGAQCSKMHLFECPEFASTGKCTRAKCDLQHTVRAKKAQAAPEPALRPRTEHIDVSQLLDSIGSDDEESEKEGGEQEEDEQEEKVSEIGNEEGDDSGASSPSLDPEDFDHVDKKRAFNDGTGFIEL